MSRALGDKFRFSSTPGTFSDQIHSAPGGEGGDERGKEFLHIIQWSCASTANRWLPCVQKYKRLPCLSVRGIVSVSISTRRIPSPLSNAQVWCFINWSSMLFILPLQIIVWLSNKRYEVPTHLLNSILVRTGASPVPTDAVAKQYSVVKQRAQNCHPKRAHY